MTIRATYEKGVLRPAQSLALQEGATVDLEIIERIVPGTALPPPTPEEAAYIERLKAAKTLKEAFEVMDTAPPFPEGYDLEKALNANRKAMGERLLYPDVEEEIAP